MSLFKYYHPGEEDGPDFGLASWCCYALNVTDEAIWTQYYTQMLVTKIGSDGSISRWRPLRRGARALAIAGRRIGLLGRYDPFADTLFVYRLEQPPKSKVAAILRILCGGVPLTADDEVIGRGDTLYSVARLLQVTVSQLLNWNGIGRSGTIKPGQRLVAFVARS